MTDDPRHFSAKTKRAAWKRCNGRCESCTVRLRPGHIHYDHDICWELSRNSSLENCRVLCVACHETKTAERDIPTIARVRRMGDAHHGIAGPGKGQGPKLPCGVESNRRKTIKGRVVERKSQAELHRDAMARRYGGFQ